MTLSAQAIERININSLTAELMARKWHVYLPVYDDGIDMLATCDEGATLLRIQLKSRWSINRKYSDRQIEIAFHEAGIWYLVPHDHAVEIGRELGYTDTQSWKRGSYTVGRMSKKLSALMMPYRLDEQLGPSHLDDD